jgi:hypothetical protein
VAAIWIISRLATSRLTTLLIKRTYIQY